MLSEFMKSLTVVSICALITAQCNAGNDDRSLWYKQPADMHKWEQAVPLGNGRLGVMVFGGTQKERLILNEDSLWSGWSESGNDREGASEALAKVRQAIRNGDTKTANKIALEDFCSLYGYGKPDFGAYQSFCDINFDIGHPLQDVENYRRDLDLQTAVATVAYRYKGINYKREYFSSYLDQVAVVRFSADKPGSVNFDLTLSSLHKNVVIAADKNEILLSGNVDTKSNGKHRGMTFQCRLQVFNKGGDISVKKGAAESGDRLVVSGADEVTLIIAGATDYKLKYPDYKGIAPETQNDAILWAVKGDSFEHLLANHIADYQKLFSRVEIDLGGSSREDLPTDKRLKAYKKDRNDMGLEELLFQYGRYLMIASSRPGCMPANLQGLWNNSNSPAWNCDYHLNINLQMNYWPVDLCNLSECAEPLIRWTKDLTIPGSKSAKVHYNSAGWVAHHCCNSWGYTPPGPRRGIHMLEAESGAFLCQNIWDHFAFTQDKAYLKKYGWPILKGAAEFWADNLQEVDGGYLAVSPGYSPEHGPLSDGAYYSTMIVWDLFSNCIEASKVLNVDKKFAEKLVALRARLQPLTIGEYGQLQEWRDPKLNKGANKDHHRHVSHMYAVYPGKQIIIGRDDVLAKAARQAMIYRGDNATGWSMGWKVNLWARFLDGDHAHKMIENLISGKLFDNMWDAHPPFQIDGNFGVTAGIAEMLIQSHTGEIRLLPALPKVWSAGSVKGLRARGGYTVDLAWKDAKLTSVTVTADKKGTVCLTYGDKTISVPIKSGETITRNGRLK